jgi:hypothetical protein
MPHSSSTLNSMDTDPSSQDPSQPFAADNTWITVEDHQWEKEVERDLLLMLQAWHASSEVESARQDGADNLDELLNIQSRYFRNPVYFPLAGNTEQNLGDALAAAAQLLLIECKTRIGKSEWAREALPERQKSHTTELDKTEPENRGGKNRKAQLATVDIALRSDAEKDRAKNIANSCHFLVASHLDQKQEASDGERTLQFTYYWNFVMEGPYHGGTIECQPADNLKAMGASFDEFKEYVMALVKAREARRTDIGRLETQLIVLALRNGVWHGYRANDANLTAALNAAIAKRLVNKRSNFGLR